MHIHNVADFAPPGYRLERTDYGDKKCRHTFVKAEAPDLVCELVAHDAAEEREALEAFRALHTASLPEGVPPFEMPPPWSSAAPSDALITAHVKAHAAAFARGEVATSDAEDHDTHVAAYIEATSPTEPPPKPKSRGKR